MPDTSCLPLGTLLPRFIVPRELAGSRRVIRGVLPLHLFARARDLLADNKGDIAVTVSCHEAPQARQKYVVMLHLEGNVSRICQRCLTHMQTRIKSTAGLVCVSDDQEAAQLHRDYEPLIAGPDDRVELAALVEDELLLELPLVARHDDAGCNGSLSFPSDSEGEAGQP